MSDPVVLAPAPQRVSLVARIADRFGVDPAKMIQALKATAFRTEKPVTDEQLMSLLIVADQYKLNPFTKELFAYADKGGIVPVVSVDGWARIINEHPALDGLDFEYHGPDDMPAAITCVIWRKDRTKPMRITEYMVECKRGSAPWSSHPRRMLRHKSLIQCARLAFGFAGIYDEDEARRIVGTPEREREPQAIPSRVVAALGSRPAAAPIVVPAAASPEYAMPPAVALPATDASPMAESPYAGKTLAAYMDEVLHASDAEHAAMILDHARAALDPTAYADLCTAYSTKFTTERD